MSQKWNYLSVTPPTGFSASLIKAVYQFDGPTLGLSDRTGNGHNLTIADARYAWLPMQGEFGCNMLLLFGPYARSPLSASLGTLGAATLEFVMNRYRLADLGDTVNSYAAIGGDDDTEAQNICFCVFGGDTRNQVRIFIEAGGGTNYYTDFTKSYAVGQTGAMTYIAVTRAADGLTYKLHADGFLLDTVVATQAPTGGTNVRVYIGALNGNANHVACAYNSVRWSHGEMTEAQIFQTYRGLRA